MVGGTDKSLLAFTIYYFPVTIYYVSMDIILYEDEAIAGLAPMTLTRPAFNIRTGGYTLLEAVKIVFPKAEVFARSRAITHDICRIPQFAFGDKHSPRFLFLNARLAPSIAALNEVADIAHRSDEDFAIFAGEKIAGFCTTKLASEELADARLLVTRAKESVHHELAWKLFTHPEEIIFFNRDALGENLDIVTRRMRAKKRNFFIGKNVVLPEEFVVDTSKGAVVLGDHVIVHPYVVLRGPLFIGESSIVKEFSMIEGSTIGPVCKVGGEITGSVIDGYSNKQHAGSLGDSYVGRWVNIGGGTFVSDLKNTYSNITVGGRDSGTQFLGVIMGDFSKASINTSIFPGKVIGVSAHLYGTVAEDVPAFTSHVRAGVLFELPIRLAIKGQEAMAVRRGVEWNDMDVARMEKVFEMTAADREAKQVRKEKISFL